MSKVYVVKISDVEANEDVSFGYGDFNEVAYLAKSGLKRAEDAKGNVSLMLAEVAGVGGDDVRQVVSISAEVDVVGIVLKKKLTAERKLNGETVVETADTAMSVADFT